MEKVKDFSELRVNIDVLDKYLNSKTDPEYGFALGLIKRGTCFVVMREKDTYKFYPSRFIGYLNNNMATHLNNESKDGRKTNPVISSILKNEPTSDTYLEQLYCNYCESLGFKANKSGTAGAKRKYWGI